VGVVPAATLAEGLVALRSCGVGSLLCEGGAAFAGALLADDFVDRLVIFRAPVVLGAGALLAFGAAPAAILPAAPRWRLVEQRRIDDDDMSVYAPGT
jgi:diaminohydroxyphosphoribosylaminopyrimidine deaminase/5-amino-6-(5-phosphoribosylamino)uracil reductase